MMHLKKLSKLTNMCKDFFKTFLAMSAIAGFEEEKKSLDVTTAFLQGYPLERDIFIKPPPEKVTPGKSWKLKKKNLLWSL